jgi:heme-degrading monooxygenase HmoA
MAHVLVRQNVEDYSNNEVFVLLEWDSMEKIQQFAQSDELKERMQQAGVTGPPDIYFINLVDSPSA